MDVSKHTYILVTYLFKRDVGVLRQALMVKESSYTTYEEPTRNLCMQKSAEKYSVFKFFELIIY